MKNKNQLQPSVMIVDDSETMLLTIKEQLLDAGVSPLIICNDSQQVLDLIAENRVGVLVLYLVTPHIGGEELLKKVSNRFPEIPVIVLTALAEVDTAVRCMKAGAFDCVVKGTGMHDFLNAVRHALKLRKSAWETESLGQCIRSDRPENPEAFAHIIAQDKKCSLFSDMSKPLLPVLIRC